MQVPGRVSVLLPSRQEVYLAATVRDVLTHATGDLEVIAILDGYWLPSTDLPIDPRFTILHHGQPLGMRPAINHAAAIATGEYLMKADAHCAFQPGFDAILKRDYHERNWVVVPRRDRLDAETWTRLETGKPPVDAHYLSYSGDDFSHGLHGEIWKERAAARADVLLDEEMSSQGSCWFMAREHWTKRIGPLDSEHYGTFTQEFQEIGLKTWLGGGAVMVNKRTTYLHLHKQQRGYSLDGTRTREGAAYSTAFWMGDQWAGRCRNLRWLIEHFNPPTWPTDLDTVFRRAA